MTLSHEQVEKVALLGRLLISPQQLASMTVQLGSILEYMERLGEVETADVEPMAHALDVCDVFRDDQLLPSLPREQALANAPHRDQECYRVPAVLGAS